MIQGDNNSRIIDQLTDSQGSIIFENWHAIVRQSKTGAMRFPGGTLARDYTIDAAGYDNRGKLYNGKNVVGKFVQLVKEMGVPVTLVLNVGKYDTFYWQIDKSKAAEYLDMNKRLIDTFLNAGVPIFCVELGNEEYLHVPKGSVLPTTWRYNAFQRMLGQPARDIKLRQEVTGYYEMYADIYHTHAELVSSFGLDAAVPMVNNTNEKWRLWNQAVLSVPAKYGVWHHYEDKDKSKWQGNIDSYIEAIQAQGRIPICTEWAAWFGDQGDQNKQLSGQFRIDYNRFVPAYLKTRGDVPLILRHRLNGNPATWKSTEGTPYDTRP